MEIAAQRGYPGGGGRIEHNDGVTNLVADQLQPLSTVYPQAAGILPSRHRSRDFR